MPAKKLAFVFLLAFGPSIRLLAAPAPWPVDAGSNPVRAGLCDDMGNKPQGPVSPAPAEPEGRYFFDLLDHRSRYGRDFFPDLFLGPEFDRETQAEVDYVHGEKGSRREDEGDAEFQWNLTGQLTLTGEFGYDSAHQPGVAGAGPAVKGEETENGRGFENVNLGLYHPVFQAVSKDDSLDYSAVVRLDVGIPTRTAVSGTDIQLTPYLGQLLRVGHHVSVEAWAGSQFTIGPHQIEQIIYGAAFGYQISRDQMSWPFTRTVTPMLELDGRAAFPGRGQDALFGVAGLNWQFTGQEDLPPRLGIGYEFPIDQGARDQLHWGIITQVFLDF